MPRTDSSPHQPARRRPADEPGRRWALALGCLAVCGQLWGLYAPRQPEAPSAWAWLPLDKFVHFGMFATPCFLFLLAGFRARTVAAVFLAHAVVSELVQGFFLPHRSGDPLDALTDAGAVLVGLALAAWLRRRSARAESGRA